MWDRHSVKHFLCLSLVPQIVNLDYIATAPKKLTRMFGYQFLIDFHLFKEGNRTGTTLSISNITPSSSWALFYLFFWKYLFCSQHVKCWMNDACIHVALICKAIQDIGVMISGMKSLLSPTYRKWTQLPIAAIYHRFFWVFETCDISKISKVFTSPIFMGYSHLRLTYLMVN